MGSEFTFYDYMEGGENLIHAWLEEIPKSAKAKLTNWLLHLEATPPGEWKRPQVDTLAGECQGLFEVRAEISRVQYRLLGCHDTGERTPTLLHGCIKPGKKVPKVDCDIALRRKEEVRGDLNKRREIHRFD